ncbi:MAG: hypothetical protein ABI263_04445 [Gelidibacter sp.]
MKTFIHILIFVLSFSSAFSNPIMATIIFENNTDKTSISGVLYITETNQSFTVNSLNKFTVELPKKGLYHFEFYSEDVQSPKASPMIITERKNTIKIRLENKGEDISSKQEKHFPLKDISDFSPDQLQEAIVLGRINFIVHGLIPPPHVAVKIFKSKYGVGFTSENCVVDPISFKIAMNTNKRIEAYLTSKYGSDWENEIPAQPFGLQLGSF